MIRALLAILLLISTAPGSADITRLYDDATLQHWGVRYEQSTRKILDQLVWPALLSAEKQQFGGQKTQLEFPRYARGDARQNPLAFYVPGDGRPAHDWPIVFPQLSLKFLDDLCTAYAWLQINGYSLETISEYNALLKHARPPPGGWPPPLAALGVPENALADPRVDELALGHFVTARTFLLLHEMGHVFHAHHASSYADSVRNEREADAFAARVMPRTGLPPLGALVFFLADAHWSGYPASGADTHPLTGERLRALASAVDARELAQKLRALGELLDDPDIRAGFAASGKAGDLAALAPRRPGESPLASRGRDHDVTRDGAPLFDGHYRGEMQQFSAPQSFPVEVQFERRGERVTGRYSFGLGIGRIDGQLRGKRLEYEWEWAGNYGRGVLQAEGADGFRGRWGYRESNDNAGTWNGRRLP
jgi:hypothetical protein